MEDDATPITTVTCLDCGETAIAGLSGLVFCRRCGSQVRPRAVGAKAFVVDSNAYNVLVATPERQHRVISAHEQGHIEFLMTHVQFDEMIAIPDENLRNLIAGLPIVVTPTHGVVLGTSKPGLARFGKPESIEAFRSESGGHTHDALIGATAAYEGAVLVTGDRRLRNRARAKGVEVWSAQELVSYIEALSL